MAEYIEREALVHHFMTTRQYLTKDLVMDAAYEVSKFPAADVVPVVHGHWDVRCCCTRDDYTGEVDEQFYLECSECKRAVWECDQTAAMMADYRKMTADFPFCHCGATMDGGGGNGI